MERPTVSSVALRVGRELVSSLRSMCDSLYEPGKLVACELVTGSGKLYEVTQKKLQTNRMKSQE